MDGLYMEERNVTNIQVWSHAYQVLQGVHHCCDYISLLSSITRCTSLLWLYITSVKYYKVYITAVTIYHFCQVLQGVHHCCDYISLMSSSTRCTSLLWLYISSTITVCEFKNKQMSELILLISILIIYS